MKWLTIYSFLFLLASCGEKDITPQFEPIEIGDRETLLEIDGEMAFLDVEKIEVDSETKYAFLLELKDNQGPKFLHVSNDQLLCGFLDEQMMFGSSLTSDCAERGYFYRYLLGGFKKGNYRLHVKVSGKLKEKFEYDLFSGEPFVLENITKIPTCPVTFEVKDVSPSLRNNFWQFQGFIDEQGDVVSYPTCEDPEIGIFFYDSLLLGVPLTVPEAKSFEIRTEVSIRPPQLFHVYSFDNRKIKISMALNPGWMPPRPATAQTDNYSRLTVDIKNKYDSLNLILRVSDGIEFAINQNTLLLYNPETKIRARFFIP